MISCVFLSLLRFLQASCVQTVSEYVVMARVKRSIDFSAHIVGKHFIHMTYSSSPSFSHVWKAESERKVRCIPVELNKRKKYKIKYIYAERKDERLAHMPPGSDGGSSSRLQHWFPILPHFHSNRVSAAAFSALIGLGLHWRARSVWVECWYAHLAY